MKISVVINTYNAQKYLERVLRQVSNFDEIVICDMYSTDDTIMIAQKYNCKIVYHELTGIVEPARNFAIQSASHPWVLVLDADEIVPAALHLFLYEYIKKQDCANAIRIPMKNFFMNQFMHAAYPSYLLRFFKKDCVDWPPYVHSQPQIKGSIYTIPASRKELALIHLSNDSIETYINKSNIYSKQEIARRENKKYNLLAILYEPGFRFFKQYILKGGYKDGKAGLCYALLYAFYKFLTIAKIWEIQNRENKIDSDLLDK